jgi:hypothetical protein
MKPWTMLASLLLAPVVAAASGAGGASRAPSERYVLPALGASARLAVPAIDTGKAMAEDAVAPKGKPPRYAIVNPVRADALAGSGQWTSLGDGIDVWRLEIRAPNARSIDLGFTRFFLPHGAALWLRSPDGRSDRGPFTDADNEVHGQLWTPIVIGESVVVELEVPRALREAVRLELTRVNSGYRDFWNGTAAKSGSCNVDVVCPEGNAWRDQIRSVAVYGLVGQGTFCTGELMNNTRGDRAPLFMTANHCQITPANAASIVVYWNYQNSTCRTPGGGASGGAGDGNLNQFQTGSIFRAKAADSTDIDESDFVIVELDDPPSPAFNVFFAGWDRRDIAPASATTIHHPNTDEKRISFENDPLSITQYLSPTAVGGGTHLRIADWDTGTTEPGSSGSPLFSPEKRVVGVLSGGNASCTSQTDDWYGRLAVGWEGLGTPTRRLKDWLDPAGTNAAFIDGTNVCTPPTIALDGPTTGFAGQSATFTAVATGAGPFTFAWDVDNDGTTDRTQANLTSSASISPSYATATTTNVVVRVTDATGCTGQAQRAINVSAPDIVATAQAAQQVCGDGDAAIEPGERWRVPVRLFNAGGKALDGAHAVFAPAAPASSGGDSFGHRVIDSSNAGCRAQFVDIGDAPVLPLVPSGTVGAQDDGRTAPIALGAGAFSFYGQPVTQLVMSTNGYLSTDAGDSGGDYDNTCALAPPDLGSSGGRLNVQHDDLVVQSGGGLRTRFFATCPRPPDSGTAPAACTVFQWNNMGQFATGGANGNAVFQAIVYAGTNEIVYQYQSALPDTGGSATIGIQNAAASDRAQYACETPGSAPAGRAVCVFDPASLPSTLVPARLRVETPAPAVNNLGSGQEQVVNVDFRVDDTAVCGSPVNLRYVGTVDNVAYSVRSGSVLATTLGAGGACNASQCPASPAPIAANDGFFANPSRFGNGIGAFNIGTTWFGLWFTGERNRFPTWLALQGDRIGDQVVTPILRFRRTSDNPWAVTSTVVGEAQVSYVGPDEYVLTWVLDGVPGGEQQNSLYPRAPRPNPNRTGAWFFPAESGWGTAYDDHVLGGNFDQVGINYLYGGDGTARWSLGSTSSPNAGAIPQTTFLVHCPSCPNFADFLGFPLDAGTVSRTFTSQTLGTQTMGVVFPAPLSGSFTRTAVPFQMLTTPQPQGQ